MWSKTNEHDRYDFEDFGDKTHLHNVSFRKRTSLPGWKCLINTAERKKHGGHLVIRTYIPQRQPLSRVSPVAAGT